MSWLSNRDIIHKIRRNGNSKTVKAFDGVYPIDKLPEFVSHLPFLMIVNTHTHNLKGEHWKTICIDEERNGEIFDSLAQPVSNILKQWMNRFTRKWKTNRLCYQNPLSATCGAYALYFSLLRLEKTSFEELMQTLTRLPHVNEYVVRAFFNRLK